MNFPRFSISRKIIFYILSFFTLSILLVYCLNNLYIRYNTDITNEVGNRQLIAARTLATKLEDNIKTIVDDLCEGARYASLHPQDQNSQKEMIANFFSEFSLTEDSTDAVYNDCLVSVRWIDERGRELLTLALNGDPLSPSDSASTSFLSSAEDEEGSFHAVGPYLSPDNLRIFWLTVPMRGGESGEVLGLLAAEINLDRFVHYTLSSIHTDVAIDLLLMNRNGDILHAHNHPELFMTNLNEVERACFECHKDFNLPQRAIQISEGWGMWEHTDYGELYAYSTLSAGDLDWSVALGFPETTLSSLLGHFISYFYLSLILALGFLGLLTYILLDFHRKRLRAEEQANFLQHRAAFLREKKEMDQRYIELVEKANDAIYILQGDRFVLVNRAFENLHGYPREELLSPDFDMMSIVAPEYRDYIIERGNKQERGEELEPTYQFQVMRKNGEKVDVEVSVTYIQFNGKPAVQGVLRDISERKRTEEQKEHMLVLSNTIRDSKELDDLARNTLECLTKILNMSSSAFYIFDDRRNELQLISQRGIWEENLPVQERYRMTEDEVGVAVQTAFQRDIIIVDDMESSDRLSYIQNRSTLSGKSLISMPLVSQNVFLGVIQFAMDQSRVNWQYDMNHLKQIANAIALGLHRRKISTELAESERRLKHFFENSKEVIYIASAEGDLTYLNKTGCDILEHTTNDGSINIIRHWKSEEMREEYMRELREKGFVQNMEVEYPGKDGEMHSFLESSVAMRDEDGNIVEIQGSMTDITSLKKAEEEMRRKNIELKRVNAELRELDQMKDNFIATISHELRTPLTSIKGAVDLLMKGVIGELDEKKKEILSICKRNSTRLIDLVNDLLEIQHLQSGRTKLELKPLEIEGLIPELVEKASNDCNKEEIHFKTRIDTNNHGRIVLGDQAMISHAMSNLLSNAIKFSDKGTISIEVSYHDGEVHLSVSDEGIGIPYDLREKIFDRFTQGDASMTRVQGGTGLGLALTRIIVEKHGGRIWVESKKGSGSKFTFSLPCYPKKDNDDDTKPGSQNEGTQG